MLVQFSAILASLALLSLLARLVLLSPLAPLALLAKGKIEKEGLRKIVEVRDSMEMHE